MQQKWQQQERTMRGKNWEEMKISYNASLVTGIALLLLLFVAAIMFVGVLQ